MEAKTKDFWQDHSIEYLELAFKHEYQERVIHADGYGKRTGECGDTVEFFIMAKDGEITSISYDINGCINTNACANAVIVLANGKKIQELWDITHEDVAALLKTLPVHEEHCAQLAVGAFYLALRDLEKKQHSAVG